MATTTRCPTGPRSPRRSTHHSRTKASTSTTICSTLPPAPAQSRPSGSSVPRRPRAWRTSVSTTARTPSSRCRCCHELQECIHVEPLRPSRDSGERISRFWRKELHDPPPPSATLGDLERRGPGHLLRTRPEALRDLLGRLSDALDVAHE